MLFSLKLHDDAPLVGIEDDEFGVLLRKVYGGIDAPGFRNADIRIEGLNPYSVVFGEGRKGGLDRESAVGILNMALELWMRKRSRDGLCRVHSSSVAYGNKALALLGVSGSGKTTLSLALSERGAAFIGDEYGFMDCCSGVFGQERMPVKIKAGGYWPAKALYPTNGIHVLSDCGVAQRVVARQEVRCVSDETAFPLAALAFPSFSTSAPNCELGHVDLSLLPQLLMQSIDGAEENMRILVSILSVISTRRIRLVRLSYSDAEVAAKRLLLYLDGDQAQ